jgi:hypothetical protein
MNDHEHLSLRHVARAACQSYVIMMAVGIVGFVVAAPWVLWALGGVLRFLNNFGNGAF